MEKKFTKIWKIYKKKCFFNKIILSGFNSINYSAVFLREKNRMKS